MQDGLEERAANVLNAVMVRGIVLAVGLVVVSVGLWTLWHFAASARTGGLGGNTGWMDLGMAVILIAGGIQAVRFGVGMTGRKSRS